MKDFKFASLRVLEFLFISALFYFIVQLSFYLLNLSSSIGNTIGLFLLVFDFFAYLYYVGNFAKRIHNYLDSKF